jgi:antitoxin ParD1/3/4
MTTMNISLPQDLKAFVDEQVADKAYSTSSEYVRELIRREREKERLRKLLLDGAAAPGTEPADSAYFEELRQRVRERATK